MSNQIAFVIPGHYVPVYTKLLKLLSNFGVELIKDCNAACDSKKSIPSKCFIMFQTACSAYALKEYNKADFIVNYIIEELKLGLNKVKTVTTDDRVYYGNANSLAEIKSSITDNESTVYTEGMNLIFKSTKNFNYIWLPDKYSISSLKVNDTFKDNNIDLYACENISINVNDREIDGILYYYQLARSTNDNIISAIVNEAKSSSNKCYYTKTSENPYELDLSEFTEIEKDAQFNQNITHIDDDEVAVMIIPENKSVIRIDNTTAHVPNILYAKANALNPISNFNNEINVGPDTYIKKRKINNVNYVYWVVKDNISRNSINYIIK